MSDDEPDLSEMAEKLAENIIRTYSGPSALKHVDTRKGVHAVEAALRRAYEQGDRDGYVRGLEDAREKAERHMLPGDFSRFMREWKALRAEAEGGEEG